MNTEPQSPQPTTIEVQAAQPSLLNRLGLGGIALSVLLVVLLGVSCWYWWNTHRTLTKSDEHVTSLQADSTAKHQQLRENALTIGTLQLAIARRDAAADRDAADFQSGIDKANKRVDEVTDQLTPKELKQKADETVAGVGAVPTTADDTLNNKYYVKLKGKYKVLQDSTKKLVDANANLRVQLDEEKAHGQDLVTELNGTKKAIADTRTFVQDKRSKASSNVFKQVVNAGKIKAFGEIDEKLQEAQKP